MTWMSEQKWISLERKEPKQSVSDIHHNILKNRTFDKQILQKTNSNRRHGNSFESFKKIGETERLVHILKKLTTRPYNVLTNFISLPAILPLSVTSVSLSSGKTRHLLFLSRTIPLQKDEERKVMIWMLQKTAKQRNKFHIDLRKNSQTQIHVFFFVFIPKHDNFTIRWMILQWLTIWISWKKMKKKTERYPTFWFSNESFSNVSTEPVSSSLLSKRAVFPKRMFLWKTMQRKKKWQKTRQAKWERKKISHAQKRSKWRKCRNTSPCQLQKHRSAGLQAWRTPRPDSRPSHTQESTSPSPSQQASEPCWSLIECDSNSRILKKHAKCTKNFLNQSHISKNNDEFQTNWIMKNGSAPHPFQECNRSSSACEHQRERPSPPTKRNLRTNCIAKQKTE